MNLCRGGKDYRTLEDIIHYSNVDAQHGYAAAGDLTKCIQLTGTVDQFTMYFEVITFSHYCCTLLISGFCRVEL